MKKITLFAFLAVAMLLLAGCGGSEAGEKDLQVGSEAKEAEGAGAAEALDENAAKIAEYKSTILSSLVSGGESFMILPGQSTADENGEGYFIVGIRNNLPGEEKYRLVLTHANAHTITGIANNLPMDETAVGWFKSSNDLGPYMVGSPGLGEFSEDVGIKIVTIYYKIGPDAAKDSATKIGNYRFNVEIQNDKGKSGWEDWRGIGSKKSISIKNT